MDLINDLFFDSTALGIILFTIFIIWVLFWKIYSVWFAAKSNNKIWFVILLVFNTFGILDIIYVFGVLKKTIPEVKNDISKTFHKIKNKLK
ncbi:MAG: DUF5652 family protein [Candidatus Paceibacterota bacterium]